MCLETLGATHYTPGQQTDCERRETTRSSAIEPGNEKRPWVYESGLGSIWDLIPCYERLRPNRGYSHGQAFV